MTPNNVNGVRVAAASLTMPETGVWYADLTLDLDVGQSAPTGRVALMLADSPCVCTVDDAWSGAFGENTTVRVRGGGGGWGKEVAAQHYHNDGGVLLSSVAVTTGVTAGEVVTVLEDAVLGTDFVRAKERASRVLDGVSWWVGLDGVTRIGKRVEAPIQPALGAEVLEYDPASQIVTLAADGLVEPGAVLTDSRFGRLVVRDVEIQISSEGFRVNASVGKPAGARLLSALRRVALEASGAVWCRSYRYKVVVDAGDRLVLQAVRERPGLPDLLPVSIWHGVPGISAVMLPGAEVLVEFLEGDPAQPIVVAFEPSEGAGFKPLLLTLDALTLVQVGSTPLPVAHASEVLGSLAAISAALVSIQGAVSGHTPQSDQIKYVDFTAILNSAVNAMVSALVLLAPTLPTTKLVAQ